MLLHQGIRLDNSTTSNEQAAHCVDIIILVSINLRQRRKAWSDKEDRDDIAFWEQQKKEYLQLNPTHHQMIAEFEAEVDTAEDVYMEDVV